MITSTKLNFHQSHDPEKIPEQSSLPHWYRFPQWTVPTTPRWMTWSNEDLPTAKSASTIVLGYLALLPPRFLVPGGLMRAKTLHPTAYLDALRGWAALLVARYHMFYNTTWLFEQHIIRGFPQWPCNGSGVFHYIWIRAHLPRTQEDTQRRARGIQNAGFVHIAEVVSAIHTYRLCLLDRGHDLPTRLRKG